MAEATLPSPPTTTTPRPYGGEEERPEENAGAPLAEQLDLLLERYLELVDTYTSLRTQLTQSFSAGFFSLAQANRHCTLGPGRRYGPDGYDERMKASRRVRVRERGPREERPLEDRRRKDGEPQLPKEEPLLLGGAGGDGLVNFIVDIVDAQQPKTEDTGVSNEAKPLPPPSSPPPHISHKTTPPHADSNSTKTITAKPPPDKQPPSDTTAATKSSAPPAAALTSSRNPLHWYGILVPPALRAAQTHFGSAVAMGVPGLLGAAAEIAALEARIAQLRAELGGGGSAVDNTAAVSQQQQQLEQEPQLGREEAEAEAEAEEAGVEKKVPSSTTSIPTASKSTAKAKAKSKRQTIADRTVSSATDAPRSRLLKLDG